jgi:hypothetical protein
LNRLDTNNARITRAARIRKPVYCCFFMRLPVRLLSFNTNLTLLKTYRPFREKGHTLLDTYKRKKEISGSV